MRGAALAVTAAALGCAGDGASGDDARAALGVSPDVVISQVYGGGGNASAPFTNDFVELFNRGTAAVSLAGWSVQYASATGTGNFGANPVVALSGVLAPGQHYLVQLAGGATGAPLPAADATGSINMSGTAGKVVVARVATGLACNGGSVPCPPALEANMVDLVGYGTANYFETAPAPAASNTTAVLRRLGGCTETDSNAADFEAGAPAPRNRSAAATPCGGDAAPTVASTSPAEGEIGAPIDATVSITFSEPVSVADGSFAIDCSQSGPVGAAVSGGPETFVLDPAVDLQPGESCTVTVSAAGVVDGGGNAMAADFTLTFGITPPFRAIREVQGAGHISPIAGSGVTTRGVVTAVRSTGFYLQDPSPDADDATSEAVFVFTDGAPSVSVGDDATVRGRVAEFRPGCTPSCAPTASAFANLTTTEIDDPSVEVHGQAALPAPIVIGAGGRLPPASVVEDDAGGSVEEPGVLFDPAADGVDFYESLEGMRVQLNDAVAVGHQVLLSGGAIELAVLGDGGAHAGVRTSRGGIVLTPGDFNPERVILANAIVPAIPAADVGDRFPGSIVGVMDYSFGNYKFLATAALPALVSGGNPREVVSFGPAGPVDLDVAAFNVENLDALDPQSKFDELAAIVVAHLGSPDLLALEEIQDNDGPANSGTVDASRTIGRLVDAIAAAGGPAYTFRSVDPVNNQDGGEPGGNIRVGFLFRTDRGLAFVDRPGAGPLTPNAVTSAGGAPSLTYSPGRIDPQNTAFTTSRKPLAAELTYRGQTLFVVANHFNSKGGDQALFGRFQPPTLVSEVQRRAQARVVADFVGQILAVDPDAHVIVLGDLNDFQFSPPVQTLLSAGLTTLVDTLPPAERYTYVFDGNSQVLDHVLVSRRGLARLAGFDVVHVNAEFAVQASDHDPGVARFSFDAVAPVITAPGDLVAEAEGPGGARVTFQIAAHDDVDGPVPVVCSPASGSLFALGSTAVSCSAEDSRGNTAQAGFTVSVVDTTAPVLRGVPDAASAFATEKSGARVSYAVPTAVDRVDGNRPVACAPASGSRFGLGQTVVTCSAADAAGNRASQSFPVSVTYSAPTDGSFYLAPLQPDGSAVFRRGTLLIPVRFRLTGPSAGIADAEARLFLFKVEGTSEIPLVPWGLPYLYERLTRQYLFPLPALLLQPGRYRIRTELGDGVPHTVDFSVRR